VDDVHGGYGRRQILFGIDFALHAGEVVALLGANGSGKSTVLNTIGGFVQPWRGTIRFAGRSIAGLPAHAIARSGIATVSQGRDLFPDMTVQENLRLGAMRETSGERSVRMQRCFTLFPRLAERRAQIVRLMSGGEQQMVAIARALMSQPDLLLLDEPMGGIAPRLVQEIVSAIQLLREDRLPVLLVEHNLKVVFALADRFLILRDGTVEEEGNLHHTGCSQQEIVRRIYL
jgi:branched-chain amino acid transport system ATP-binding protein